MRRNILLKKRIGCLLAAALLAGEIGSASIVAVAAPVETTQTKVENQMENKPEVVDIPEEYITFGEPVVSEPDVKAEELDAAKAQSQENVQEKIPVIRLVEESETESLDVAKQPEGAEQKEALVDFPESIPVLGGGVSATEEEKLDVVGNSEEGEAPEEPESDVEAPEEPGSDVEAPEEPSRGDDPMGGSDSGSTEVPGESEPDWSPEEPTPEPTPEQPMPSQPVQPGVSANTVSISVNDVIYGSGHNGVFENKYFTFTPETSGYYGFYASNMNNCSIDCSIWYYDTSSPMGMAGMGCMGYNSGSNTYSCNKLEAGRTYDVTLSSSYVGIEYSYEMKWIAFDKIEAKIGETEVAYKQETILDIEDRDVLYSIKLESEKGYDYELKVTDGSDKKITLKNGEENFFFYGTGGYLCLKKNVGVEEQVKITLQKVPATKYISNNEFQEIKQYKDGLEAVNSTYSLLEYTPEETGKYTVAVEMGTGINVYSYDAESGKLQYTSAIDFGVNNGAVCSLEGNKTYYILLRMATTTEDQTVLASIQKKRDVEQQIGTAVTYQGDKVIPLKIAVTPNKGYRVKVEKKSNEQYSIYNDFSLGTCNAMFSETCTAFTGMVYKDELTVFLTKYNNFEQSDEITVTVEEYEIPELKKDEVTFNENDMMFGEQYIAKIEVDETATYELCGINYNSNSSHGYIYEEYSEGYENPWLNCIRNFYFYDSSFNEKMQFEAGKTYYLVVDGYNQAQPGDVCLYLSKPVNYEMDLTNSGENAVSCDMKMFKSAEINVTVPESGFYELSANGKEDHYEVSSSGMDSGLSLYKDQPKLAYFNSPGTYTVKISREFMAEGFNSEKVMDEVTFVVKKSSDVKNIPLYDGTETTEFEVTLRESGDYSWYSFTPEKDGCYTLKPKWHDEDYGTAYNYIYEIEEDYLNQVYYSNDMYELDGGKTYYIKFVCLYGDGANRHYLFLENVSKEIALNESVSVETRNGMLAKARIEENSIYKLTITTDEDCEMHIGTSDAYYTMEIEAGVPNSRTFYLNKGEKNIAIYKINSEIKMYGLTIQLEKVNVQDDMQEITMDKGDIWVKYVPSKTQTSMLGISNATSNVKEIDFYYESEGYLYDTYLDSRYWDDYGYYCGYEFKEGVEYYFHIYSTTEQNSFSLFLQPVQQVEASSLASNEVDVDVCTELQYEEKVKNGFYEVKVTGNTSPIKVKVGTNTTKYFEFDTNGGTEVLEVGKLKVNKKWTSDIDVSIYNFSGQKTSAKVEINKITPLEKEITLNETLTRTVEGIVETYTFTPEKDGYYQLDLEGISSIKMRRQDKKNGSWIKSGRVNRWYAGNTYVFYLMKEVGTQFSLKIKEVKEVQLYDYDEYSAFIASGGSISIMNRSDVTEDMWNEYYDDDGYIDYLDDNKVLVTSTSNFKNLNDRWYPYSLYSTYVDDTCTTYGDLEQRVEPKYDGRIYDGLYNEALKKMSVSDPFSELPLAVVKYVPKYIAVQQIKLSGPTVMKAGDTITFQAVLDTMNHYSPTDPTVTWSSSDSNVLTVNANGEVTAKGPGTAAVIVKSNDRLGKSASITITVHQDVVYAETVTITGSQSVYVGDEIQLTATVKGKNNAEPTAKGVTWTTSDATVAKVDANGKVTGLKQGTVTITAASKDGKAVGTYQVSVQNIIEQKISLNESKITMKKGAKYTWLKVDFKPENTTDKTLKWESNNKKVVTVNDKGVLTAKGIGKATITVTSANGKKDKVNVTVTKYAVKVKKVSTTSKKTIMEGEKVTLPLEVTPVNATNQKMKWKSSNEDVATVSSKGVVTAKKAGKATITVTAQDGSKKSSKCVITVKELSKVKSVKVKSAKKKTVEISWASVEDADGYAIYMATEKNGKYKKIATTKKDVTSYTKTKLKSKKIYYFKICAIRKVGKKQYEGKLGKAAKVKVK